MKKVSFFNLPPSPPDSHNGKEFGTTPVPRKRRTPVRRSPMSNGVDKSQRSIKDYCTKTSPENSSAAESGRPRREATKRGAEDAQAKSSSAKKNKMQNGVEAAKEVVPQSNGTSSSDNHSNAEESTREVGDDIYEVEELLDYWVNGDEIQYLVKWAGWSDDHNTWEDVGNLTNCDAKLLAFYYKRLDEVKLCKATHAKNPKKMEEILKNLPVPPDPRPLDTRIKDFFDSSGGSPSWSEINEKFHENILNTLPKWSSARVEKYLSDFLAGSLTPEDKANLRNQLLRDMALKERIQQLKALHEWETGLNGITNGRPIITVINEVDLTGPPTNFTYVNDNVPGPNVTIPNDPITGGCQCKATCFGNKKGCCPGLNEGTFAYNKKKRVVVPPGTPIFECNKYCKCGIDCANRVVQDGIVSLSDSELCIFRTDDDKGWGVKTLKPIKKGTFVALYAGEVITSKEAERRGKRYDREGLTYLFDLDLNESNGDCLYTIDAAKYGNISHFFNHSCSPNLQVYNVFVDCIDVNMPKLALFAKADIRKGAELTFDYVCKDEKSTNKVKKESKVRRKCMCGAENCRKYLF